jgi:hypothetical protein
VIIILLSIDQRAENIQEMTRDEALILIFDIKDSEADRSLAIDLV